MSAAEPPGLLRSLWLHCRPELALLAAGSLVAAVAWGGSSRPMVDTVGYRAAARGLADGWPGLLDRTPGYPLLLLATGSSDRSTAALLLAQLALHALTVVLVVDLARSCGVGRRGRLTLVLLLLAPPVLLRVPLEGTEALAAALLTLVGWLLLTPPRRSVWGRALAVGVACGAAALVRPTFALLVVPAAAVAGLGPTFRAPTADRTDRPDRPGHEVRTGRGRATVVALVAVPALLVVGGYGLANLVRFDAPTLTPLAAYHLSSRTSPYVEELPARYEPARSVLVEARDRALLQGEEMAPENFIFQARDELEAATGLTGRELDALVMEMDLVLITSNPFHYLDTVVVAATNYVVIDSQAAILALGRPVVWGMAVVHWGLLLVGATLAVTVPGLWLAGLVDRRSATVMVVALVLSAYTMAVSIMVESGTARLRAPSEPLLALALVVAASSLHGALAQLRAARTAQGPDRRVP